MNGPEFLKAITAGHVRNVRLTSVNTLQINLQNGSETFLTQSNNTGFPYRFKTARFKTAARASVFLSLLKVEVLQ